jgi:TRAP-type C4-dicarboxylate transport system permease small subunit
MQQAVMRGVDALYLVCMWIAGLALFVMTLVIPWGVYARYVMGEGSQWPEPLATLMMIVFTFSGGAVAYRAGAHIAVTMITDRVGGKAAKVLAWLVDLLMALICVFMIVWGFELCGVTWNQTVPEFPWLSVGVTYLPLPVFGIVTLLFVVEQMAFGSQKHRPVVAFGEPAKQEVPAPESA